MHAKIVLTILSTMSECVVWDAKACFLWTAIGKKDVIHAPCASSHLLDEFRFQAHGAKTIDLAIDIVIIVD
jgi:hypothetical protein